MSEGECGIFEDSETHETKLRTLEGDMVMLSGDYVVKGDHDDYWVVRKDIFEDTYEIVSDIVESE